MEAQLSLGQSWGRRAAEKVYVLKVYVPFSLTVRRPAGAPKGSPEFCGTFGVLQEGSAEHFT